jgi:hypothetical protein
MLIAIGRFIVKNVFVHVTFHTIQKCKIRNVHFFLFQTEVYQKKKQLI